MATPPGAGSPRKLIRKVSANGQITIGADYAGRLVQLERLTTGLILRFVLDNEGTWMPQPPMPPPAGPPPVPWQPAERSPVPELESELTTDELNWDWSQCYETTLHDEEPMDAPIEVPPAPIEAPMTTPIDESIEDPNDEPPSGELGYDELLQAVEMEELWLEPTDPRRRAIARRGSVVQPRRG